MPVVAEREQLPVPQARAGEPAAWDTLFKRYQLPLYVYVFELVHDEQASLDIVQEAFINAARYIAGLRDDAKFGSWLFGIAHQKCVQRWRAQRRDEDFREQLADSSDIASLHEDRDRAGLNRRSLFKAQFVDSLQHFGREAQFGE